jgi:LPS-assembly lipoprotein
MNMTRWLNGLLVTVLLLSITACGFHLRGQAQLPPMLKTLYVQGVNTSTGFGLQLKRALEQNNVEVLANYQQGSAVLTVLKNTIEQRVLSVGSSARASEYELNGLLRYQLSDPSGQIIKGPEDIEASRNYVFDQTQVLAKGDEEVMLREQIHQQLIQNMLRRLETLK